MLKITALLFVLLLVLQTQAETLCKDCEAPKTLQWTPWFDRDNPSGNGDYQTLAELIREGKNICAKPLKVDCQTTSGVPASWTGQILHISPTSGCFCVNSEQPDRWCNYDYRVRFQCCSDCPVGASAVWTPFYDRDNPSGNGDYETLAEFLSEGYPICKNPLDVNCQTLAGAPASSTGEKLNISPSGGCSCVNSQQPDGNCDFDYKVSFKCCRG